MDTQLKRGLLDICVLTAVSGEDSYGYKIIKDLSCCMEMSESTLYPILKRLEGANAVSSYSVEHSGRLRRLYRITDEGRKKIADFLEDWKDVMTIYNYIKGGGAVE